MKGASLKLCASPRSPPTCPGYKQKRKQNRFHFKRQERIPKLGQGVMNQTKEAEAQKNDRSRRHRTPLYVEPKMVSFSRCDESNDRVHG